jgi:hypothetical protein
MYDPIYLLIVLFGGALVGLIGGLLRKRHLLGIATNVLFGEAFGIAAALFWPSIDRVAPGIFNGLQALGAVGSAIFYLTPILGGFVGLAVLGVYRRWVLREEPAAPALTRKNIIIVTVILACVAALAVAG